MDQQDIFEQGRGWLGDLGWLESSFGQQPVAHQLKFTNRKNVAFADLCVVTRCVKDLHAAKARYCHKEAQKTRLPQKHFVLFVVLLTIRSSSTAVVGVAGKFAGQIEVIVDDVFEMDVGGASVGEEGNQ